jgi:hypothetical protein
MNLDKLKMTVVKTAANGVVNHLTVFTFSQTGNMVSAEYSGGKIAKGYLVGAITDNKLSFCYCQLQTDGKMDNGRSDCEIARSEKGKLQLVEHFQWGSRNDETGTNVFEEL